MRGGGEQAQACDHKGSGNGQLPFFKHDALLPLCDGNRALLEQRHVAVCTKVLPRHLIPSKKHAKNRISIFSMS